MPMLRSFREIIQPHQQPHPRDVRSDGFIVPAGLDAPPSCPRIRLRPMTGHDADEWNQLRWRNRLWLAPWDSGDPLHGDPMTFEEWMVRQRRAEAIGSALVLLIEHQTRIVGQISLGAISYGALRSGTVGYWVDQACAGHGFAPTAVGVLADWAFKDPTGPRLHRIEIDILPENERSKHVVRELGLRFEGVRRDYMFINGRWRDHESYVLLASDLSASATERVRRR